MSAERVLCRLCGRIVAGRIPARGDGSLLRPVRHRDRDTGDWCDGQYQEAAAVLIETEQPACLTDH